MSDPDCTGTDRGTTAMHAPSVTTGFATVNGTTLYYEMLGKGYPFVLIHSVSLDHRMWDDQFTALAAHYRVVRYDLRGYGQSARSEEKVSHARDLYGLLQSLGITETFLLGLGLGAAIALDVVLEHPGLANALILASPGMGGYMPSHFMDDVQERFAPLLPAWTEAMSTGDTSELIALLLDDPIVTPLGEVARRRVHDMLSDNAHVFLSPPPPVRQLTPPASQRLPEVRVPTLIVVGDRDAPTVRQAADVLDASIATARKVTMPGTSHLINMEQPDMFNRIVLDFLRSL